MKKSPTPDREIRRDIADLCVTFDDNKEDITATIAAFKDSHTEADCAQSGTLKMLQEQIKYLPFKLPDVAFPTRACASLSFEEGKIPTSC